jgi:trans-aconitate methyltransferase
MLDHEYDTMREVEDGYWWYQVLRQITTNEISTLAAGRERLKLLDAGCGTGGTFAWIARSHPGFDLHGVDLSPLALEHTKRRGFENVRQARSRLCPLRMTRLMG